MTALLKPGAPLRVGTRASALAVAQTSAIAAQLGTYELVTITSEGDRSSAPLASMGGTGVFVSALRDALRAGEVDVIVHSFKDLPTAPAEGIVLAAVPARADARDALATRDGVTLAKLPQGSRVGTGSPRRRAQLLAARPDLDVVGIRGNVDTRLGRLYDADDDRRVDGLVLAAAGLERLGRLGDASELLDIRRWPTAPAQGALALEIRADAPASLAERIGVVDHAPTHLAATAERGVLARLEAGLLGADRRARDRGRRRDHAHRGGVRARRAERADDRRDRRRRTADPLELADRVAAALLERGAATLAPLGSAR